LFFSSLLAGCASDPKLGEETPLQELLNDLPAIPIAGKNVKFKFGGDNWISTVNGKEFLAGTAKFEGTEAAATLTLKQTHVYSDQQKPGIGGDVGWIKTPGPDIILEYKKGPPIAFTVK
jgi:hypothetical protein